MTKFKLKLSLSDLMFFIPYTLYFLSFFLEDLPLEGSWFTIIKLIRYLSYALFMLDGVVISRNVLNLKAVSILALLAVYVGIMLFTKDTYFLSLAVIVYTAQKVKIKRCSKSRTTCLSFLQRQFCCLLRQEFWKIQILF